MRKFQALARFESSGTPRVFSPVLRRNCLHLPGLFHPDTVLRVFRLQRSFHNLSRTPLGLPCPSFRSQWLRRWRNLWRLHAKSCVSQRFCHQSSFIASPLQILNLHSGFEDGLQMRTTCQSSRARCHQFRFRFAGLSCVK